MRTLITLVLFAALASGPRISLGQTIGQNRSEVPEDTPTLTVRTQMVVETVVVKDKQGRSVAGLTEHDFTINEDGVPQKIRFCEHQSLSTDPLPPLPLKPQNEDIQIYKELSRTQLAQGSPESSRYKDRRLLAFYFDMTAMRPEDQLRALKAAEQFVRTQITAADLVSIMRYQGGAVDILQDFTADRTRLLSILETLAVGEGQGSATTLNDASSADTGAAFGQDDSEFNVFNTDRQLSALQTAAKMLGQLNEKKSLIYFAGGLYLNGVDNQAQLRATIDTAIRAGVSFWAIDARGLVAEAPLGDATQGSPGNAGMYTGAAALAMTTDFQVSQDTLYALAEDTGGKALLDYNDLAKGITEAQKSISDYYILGYYTTNPAQDGRFRHIKIALNNDSTGKLEYRRGYYAAKEFNKFTAVDKERQLEDALMLEDPITDLSIAMEINYFQINRAEYFVPVMIKIPGRELALAKHGGAQFTLVDFIGEIKDAYGGKTITNMRDHLRIKLSDSTATELSFHLIEYSTGFTLLPGTYSIKILARDNETGRIGTYQTNFVIPDLNVEQDRIPLSSVVLSSQRIPLKSALFNAPTSKQETKDDAVDPLVFDGARLIPSINRIFRQSDTLHIYLQGYEQENTSKKVLAFVGLYRDKQLVVETSPITETPPAATPFKTVPLGFDIPLAQFQSGMYTCQITVLEPDIGKAAFWRASIIIIRDLEALGK